MTYSFSYLEPVCCSVSSSNCCFLTCIQISQEAGKVVWYSQLFKNFPQFAMTHMTNLGWALNPGTVLIRERRRRIKTQRGRSCEDGGRDWSSCCTNQGAPRVARSLEQKRGEKHGADSPPTDLPGGVNPADNRIQTPVLQSSARTGVCCFQSHVLMCYSCPRRLIHHSSGQALAGEVARVLLHLSCPPQPVCPQGSQFPLSCRWSL